MSRTRKSLDASCRVEGLEKGRTAVRAHNFRSLRWHSICTVAPVASEQVEGGRASRRTANAGEDGLSPRRKYFDSSLKGDRSFTLGGSFPGCRPASGNEDRWAREKHLPDTECDGTSHHIFHLEQEVRNGFPVGNATAPAAGRQRGARVRLKQLDFHAAVRRSKSVEQLLDVCADFLLETKQEIGDCCAADRTSRGFETIRTIAQDHLDWSPLGPVTGGPPEVSQPLSSAECLVALHVCPHVAADFGWINSAHVLHRLALLVADSGFTGLAKPSLGEWRQTGDDAVRSARRLRRLAACGDDHGGKTVGCEGKRECGSAPHLPSHSQGSTAQDLQAAGLAQDEPPVDRSPAVRSPIHLLDDPRFLCVMRCVLHHLRDTHRKLLACGYSPLPERAAGENSRDFMQPARLFRGTDAPLAVSHLQASRSPSDPGSAKGSRDARVDSCGLYSVSKRGRDCARASRASSAFSCARVAVDSSCPEKDEADLQCSLAPGDGLPRTLPPWIASEVPTDCAVNKIVSGDGTTRTYSCFKAAEEAAALPALEADDRATLGCTRATMRRSIQSTAGVEDSGGYMLAPGEATSRGHLGIAEDGVPPAPSRSGQLEGRNEPTPPQLRFVASLCWAYGKLRLPPPEQERGTFCAVSRGGDSPSPAGMPAEQGEPRGSQTTNATADFRDAGLGSSHVAATEAGFQGCHGALLDTRGLAPPHHLHQETAAHSGYESDAGVSAAAAPSTDIKPGTHIRPGQQPCAEMLHLLESSVLRCLPYFRPRELSIGLWGLAQCRGSNPAPSATQDGRNYTNGAAQDAFWRQAVAGVRRRVPELALRELSMLAHACSTVGHRDQALMNAIASGMLRQLPTEWEQYHQQLRALHAETCPLAAGSASRGKPRRRSAAWASRPEGVSGAHVRLIDTYSRFDCLPHDSKCISQGMQGPFVTGGEGGAQGGVASRTLGESVAGLLSAFAALDIPASDCFHAVAALLLKDRACSTQGSLGPGAARRIPEGRSPHVPLRLRVDEGMKRGGNEEYPFETTATKESRAVPAGTELSTVPLTITAEKSQFCATAAVGPFLASLQPTAVTSLVWAFSSFFAGLACGNPGEQDAVSKAFGGPAAEDLRGGAGQPRAPYGKLCEASSADASWGGDTRLDVRASSGSQFLDCGRREDIVQTLPGHARKIRSCERQLLSQLTIYLATHAHACAWRYSTLDKVQLCWALALQDMYMPSLLWSALCELDSPSQPRRKRSQNASAADLQTVCTATTSSSKTGGCASDSLDCSAGSAMAPSWKRARAREASEAFNAEEGISDSFISHKQQTQLYFATVSYLTRGDTSMVLGRSVGEADKPAAAQERAPFQARVSGRQLPCSRAPGASRRANETEPLPAVPLRNGKSVPSAENPSLGFAQPSKEAASCRLGWGFQQAIDRFEKEGRSLPKSFFRCRAAINTHPDRVRHCVVSPLHVRVLIELRKILQTREERRQHPTCVLLESVLESPRTPGNAEARPAEWHKQEASPAERKPVSGWEIIPEYRDSSGLWVDIVAWPRAAQSTAW
ncbi:hypothetical protein BESB_038880 [Besnoitia besnoiti]|uniref:Uncharacterized protein n=1 Tax=Besnoitia besnoiti TaxID=94643 RepID=A0A2A9MNV6_BESBE|nr:hypothetical protein BESB_038880 [Besnoitia besnoiti]PFH37430.1 hypothetical protein BESB_038880 [Besnoitia besnoiti]